MEALPFEKLDFVGRTDSAGKVESEYAEVCGHSADTERLAAQNFSQRMAKRTIG